jgi:ABC-type uncharacterized transport system permease subunit
MMNPEIPGIIAAVLYMVSAGMQFLSLSRDIPNVGIFVRVSAAVAVFCHALTIYTDLYGAGINLGIYAMLSLMSFSIATIVLLSSFRRPLANLFIAIFPLATLSLFLELFVTDSYVSRVGLTPGILLHIALSVIAYSLLTIAALQAALLSFGDYEMRHQNLSILQHLPPLQTMEALLFETIWVGLILLSLSIVSGFSFLTDTGSPGLIHHTVITLAAWLVFAVLLWGRYQLGWRGAVASRWALTGFVLLAIGYFGSKLVLEVILGGT